MKKQEFKKKKKWVEAEEPLGRLQLSNIRIIGVSEEEEEQEIKNLFEKIMKENFPNWAKETDV